jgi:hypothetical protein
MRADLESARFSARNAEADIKCAGLEAELRVLKRNEEQVSFMAKTVRCGILKSRLGRIRKRSAGCEQQWLPQRTGLGTSTSGSLITR